MLSALPLALAALVALSILTIGSIYLASPQKISPSFGLKPPSPDADTQAWLRLKGVRDIASGLLVLTLLALANRHVLGIVLLVYAIIPLGDMTVILASGGSKSKAFSVHAATCAVMLFTALLLLHVL